MIDLTSSILYSAISKHLLQGTILDLGCGDCSSQLQSKNADAFQLASDEQRYLGIDLNPSRRLITAQIDLFDIVDIPLSYDLVLLIEVVEHIERERWSELFAIVKNVVSSEGTLIVSVPYREFVASGMTNPEDECPHVVFDIDVDDLELYFLGACFSYHGRRKRKVRTIRDLMSLGVQVLKMNTYVNPYRPIWMMLNWQKEKEIE